MKSQSDILYKLLRAGVLNCKPEVEDVSAVDWDAMMDDASEQGILAWVWDGICMLPQELQPARKYRINWGLSAQEVWAKYSKHQQVLQKIVNICTNNGVRVLLMKGIALSVLYPKPESRPCGDIDIYLFEDYAKGNRLLTGGDVNRIDKHANITIDGVLIENHYQFFEPNTAMKRKIMDYLASTFDDVVLTEDGYYTFSNEANCVFLTFHTLKHFTEGLLIPIRNVLDFAMFLDKHRQQLPSETLLARMQEFELSDGFEMLLYFSEWILGVSFGEYHRGIIPSSEVEKIKSVWLGEKAVAAFEDKNNGISRVFNFYKKRHQIRCISKHIPANIDSKSNCIREVAIFIKLLLNIPFDKKIVSWLTQKCTKK